MNLTAREKYIEESFNLDISTIKSISEIGRISGTHKYDVWIAKELKKNKELLSNQKNIYFVLDWAKKDKPNISSISFEDAFKLSEEWHKNLPQKEIHKKKEENFSNNRIIFKNSDNLHYFLLLKPEELDREGNLMRNCVGGYKGKVKAGHSLIVSLRDEKNIPHVTVEIDTKTCRVVQMRGKGNSDPAQKYLKLMTEFAIYASGHGESVDEELLELMKMKFE